MLYTTVFTSMVFTPTTRHSSLVSALRRLNAAWVFWKFNCTLLGERKYVEQINEQIQETISNTANCSAEVVWETIKSNIRKETQKYARKRGSERKIIMSQLIDNIIELEERIELLNAEEMNILHNSKLELEELQLEKTKAIMFRSKARWNIEGEKCSKYFMNLEKAKYNAKTCNRLIIDEKEVTDSVQILEAQRSFYQDLYTSDKCVHFTAPAVRPVSVSGESISKKEEMFSQEEVIEAMKGLKNGSCPGPDGLPIEIYKIFWKHLKSPFMNMMNAAYETEYLPPSCRKGVINVIPKGNKDTRFLKNLRPITLLNSDYKLIEKTLANRMLPGMEEVIHQNQTGFLPGRRICVNIRKILDAVLNAREENSSGIILSCDYLKCFDRIENCAVQGAMSYFGFAESLIKWVQILYKDFTVRVQNNGYFSNNINVTRSVHQGAPASNVLFLCVAELLAIALRNDESVKGLKLKEVMQFLNQFADDMDVISECDQESFNRILKHIHDFHDSTGFSLSYDKTSIYRVGSAVKSNAKLYSEKELNWTSETINVLGVDIFQTESELQQNYESVIVKAKNTLNSWENRHLSLLGKVTVINSLISSLFVYKMYVLPSMRNDLKKKLRELCESFLWNGRRPKIKWDILTRHFSQGGVSLADMNVKDASLKAAWVKIIFEGGYSDQYVHNIINPHIGANIWCCNLKDQHVQYVGCKSEFWNDVLKSWCKYHYDENRVESDEVLWFNSRILVEDKPICWRKYIEKGLMYLSQIHQKGGYLSQLEAKSKYSLSCMDYNTLKSAIPRYMCARVQSMSESQCFTDSQFRRFMETEKVSKFVYREIQEKNVVNTPCAAEKKWESELNERFSIGEETLRLKKCTGITKYRSFQYRFLHRAIVTNEQLFRWGLKVSNNCSFCEMHRENVRHLFYDCERVTPLWRSAVGICKENGLECPEVLTYSSVVKNHWSDNQVCASNLICLITKQYIL